MLKGREEQWTVLIITRTTDERALGEWKEELERRGCNVVVIDPDEVLEYITKHEVDAFLVDDVDPRTVPGIRKIAQVISRVRPEPAMVCLVARHNDYDHLCDLVGGGRKAIIHRDDEPNMDAVYDYLAGRMTGEPSEDLLASH